jgi:hypothetical protein
MLKQIALSLFVTGATFSAFTGEANAAQMKPLAASMTDLGDASALTYYTVEKQDYRVETVIQIKGHEDQPLRFTASLRPGQSSIISVPAGVTGRSVNLWIARVGDRLLIAPHTAVASN